jgi:aerobic carbon-monoxide dehydrogenase medium subunit
MIRTGISSLPLSRPWNTGKKEMEYSLKDFHWGREIGIQRYLQPRSLPEALEMLAENRGKALAIAGGTDVIPLLRRGDLKADVLVDLMGLPQMKGIESDGEFISLGGLVTHAQVCSSSLIREKAGLLAEAAGALGSPQIRNVATIAGNLISGQPAADTAISLFALNAKVMIASQGGEREVPLNQFFLDQGKTVLDGRREIMTRVRFRGLGKNQGGCYLRLSQRKALALPILVLAAVVTVDPEKKTIQEAALALGPVAPTPFRASRTEVRLRGAAISGETFRMAAQSASEESSPRSSLLRGSAEYRQEMVKVFVHRALGRAVVNAGLDREGKV